MPRQHSCQNPEGNGLLNSTYSGNYIPEINKFRNSPFRLVEGCKSGQIHVNSGVPQGTVLGPLLFLLYRNDMPTHISRRTSLKLFADDAMLYRKINNHTDQDNLQQDLDILIDCEQSWQMTFNPSKCEIMHITRSKSPTHNT